MEITSPNLDKTQQISQDAALRNTSRLGNEFTMYDMTPQAPKPKRSFFGGLLRGLGAIGTIGFAFPGIGTAIGLASMAGSGIGSSLEARKNAKNAALAQSQPQPQATQILYPGMGMNPMSDQVMNVVDNRSQALTSQRM